MEREGRRKDFSTGREIMKEKILEKHQEVEAEADLLTEYKDQEPHHHTQDNLVTTSTSVRQIWWTTSTPSPSEANCGWTSVKHLWWHPTNSGLTRRPWWRTEMLSNVSQIGRISKEMLQRVHPHPVSKMTEQRRKMHKIKDIHEASVFIDIKYYCWLNINVIKMW